MDTFIQKFHSGWAYLAIALLVFAVVNSFIGKSSGIILYFVSPLGSASFGQMSDKALRLTSLEHPLINIIAIVLITIGWSKHKKATESVAKFKSIALFYGLGLVLILSRIPWSLWFSN